MYAYRIRSSSIAVGVFIASGVFALALSSPARAQDTPQPPQPAPAPDTPQASQQDPAPSPDAADDLDRGADQGAETAAPELPIPIPIPVPAEPAPVVDDGDDFIGVRGQVTDETGEGLVTALVIVVDGGSGFAETDAEGRFELPLEPGKYQLEISFPMFEGKIIDVVIEPASAATANVALALSESASEIIEIVGTIDRTSEGAQLQIRKSSPVVSDILSAQEISRTPDSSASDAVKRVPSVTLEGGKYVIIRGLGDRYVSVLLNGVVLPSPEPDRQAVPLDLFPTSLLSNLTVLKSYGADLPGNFGGGALRIDTSSYPTDFELGFKVSTGLNTAASFQDVNGQSGGALDFLGYDDGTRALPEVIPSDMAIDNMPMELQERAGEAFANNWTPTTESGMPNLGLGAEVGDTLDLGRGRRLGYLSAVSFGRSIKRRGDWKVRSVKDSDTGLAVGDRFDGASGATEARLSALANVGYTLGEGHTLNAIAIYTHTGEALSDSLVGYDDVNGEDIDQTRLQFVEQDMTFMQLNGSHRLSENFELDWQGNVSMGGRDEPDSRDLTYILNDDGTRTFRVEINSGERYFATLDQRAVGGSLGVRVPLGGVVVRAGGLAQHTERDFVSRRFRYFYNLVGGDPAARNLPPEELFTPERIGPVDDITAYDLYLGETTTADDSYDGALDVFATYASADWRISDALRAVGGLRFEYSDQSLTTGSPTARGDTAVSAAESRDPSLLPALNLIYAVNDQINLRTGYSYTLARAQFRELAPAVFYDPIRRKNNSGNPDLEITRIHNTDVRGEWFPGGNAIVALSGFYKRFEKPIEITQLNTTGTVYPVNAAAANVFGVELELRSSLGRFAPALKDVRVGSNFTLIQSSIELDPAQRSQQTNRARPMQGQAGYVVNANVGYEHPTIGSLTLLYNVIGPQIVEVGANGIDDTYTNAFHKLDVVARRSIRSDLKLKLAATNLLNQAIEERVDSVATLTYMPGVSFSAGLEWTP
ncbi:MAG: TonB-dependent receptor [Haliangiales bacterium]